MGSSPQLLPQGKAVLLLRNGDRFHTGHRLVVRQRASSTWEAFLNEVTVCVQAPAAVRALYTPRQGHRVQQLDELRNGGQYVAAGFERFKKLDYLSAPPRRAPQRADVAQNQSPNRLDVSGKWKNTIQQPCVIHVFRNGDAMSPPLRFILPRSVQQDLEQVLILVSGKAALRTGAVRRLCMLDGKIVEAGEELQSGQHYVAVGYERFKKLPYLEILVTRVVAGRQVAGLKNIAKHYESRKRVSVPQERVSDSTVLYSPQSDGRRVKSTGDEAEGPAAHPPSVLHKPERSQFYAQRNKRMSVGSPGVRRKAAHDSVFRGKQQGSRVELQGAQEVAEDEHTAVELPLDQRDADAVEDEILDALTHSPRKSQQLQREREILASGRGSRETSIQGLTMSREKPHRNQASSSTSGEMQQNPVVYSRRASSAAVTPAGGQPEEEESEEQGAASLSRNSQEQSQPMTNGSVGQPAA